MMEGQRREEKGLSFLISTISIICLVVVFFASGAGKQENIQAFNKQIAKHVENECGAQYAADFLSLAIKDKNVQYSNAKTYNQNIGDYLVRRCK